MAIQVAALFRISISRFRFASDSHLTACRRFGIISLAATHGELAQLGERVTGSHEVRGSNPLFSTTVPAAAASVAAFFVRAYGATVSAGDS